MKQRGRPRKVPELGRKTTSVILSSEQKAKLAQLQKELGQPTQSDVIRILIDSARASNLPMVVFGNGGAE